MMNIFLYSLLIVFVFNRQEQGAFLQEQSTTPQENKFYTIKLKETQTILFSLSLLKINISLGNNTYFTGPITLGDQEFQVIFDIGSANFWIDSIKCKNQGCKQLTQYKPSFKSKHLGYALNVQFGTEDIDGEVNSDVIKLGDIQIEYQNIAGIIKENGGSGFDGIVGLAYPSMAGNNLDIHYLITLRYKRNYNLINFHST